MEASISKLSSQEHDGPNKHLNLKDLTDSEINSGVKELEDDSESGFSLDKNKVETEAFLREETRENVRRAIEARTGDMVISRSIKIPTKAQVEAGLSPKPISIEQEQARDLEYIKDRFPIGSDINIFISATEKTRAVVTDIKRDHNGVYLRVLFSYQGVTQWKDVAASNPISANKNIKDVLKGAMSPDQIKNMVVRMDSGNIKKAA